MNKVIRLWERMKKRSLKNDTEYRKSPRLTYHSLLSVIDCESGRYHTALLQNFNRMGICFEIDTALKPGSMVKVLFDKSVCLTEPAPLAAEVRWCQPITDPSALHHYGIGVQYLPVNA